MSITNRCLLFLLFATTGILGAFEIAKAIDLEKERPGKELCHEVSYELKEHVKAGFLSEDAAKEIILRCFREFGDSIDV